MPPDPPDVRARPAAGAPTGETDAAAGAGAPRSAPTAGIDDALAGWLDEHFADDPVMATFHGVPGHDDAVPDLSAEAQADRERREDTWLARFASFGDDQLTPDERIDRDLVLATLRGRTVLRDWQGWRRRPEHYLSPALMSVFSLFLRRPVPEDRLVAAAVARLAAIPGLLDAARANLEPGLVPRVFIRRGLGQCRAGVVYLRDLVPSEVEDPRGRARLAEAGAVAADALGDFGAHLSGMLDGAGDDEWAIGEARYSALLREVELLDDDATRLHERGHAAWAELDAEMTALARTADPLAPDWASVVRACGDDRPDTAEQMLAAYEAETARARRFLVDHGLVTLPAGERCDVVPSPPFQRPVLAVASYFAPPAFSPSLLGTFNVPYPPDGAAPDEVAERLADNSYPAIPTVTVHEAYPGHHWHLATMATARPVRRVHRSPYFTEGWALYAEKLMREHGFFTDSRAELMHLRFRIFRAARIVVDTALHTGDMTPDAAVDHLVERVALTPSVARAEVDRYCARPTQAAAYLTGALEIERLRDRWFAEGRGDLTAFHDTVASTGSLPIALAERAALP